MPIYIQDARDEVVYPTSPPRIESRENKQSGEIRNNPREPGVICRGGPRKKNRPGRVFGECPLGAISLYRGGEISFREVLRLFASLKFPFTKKIV